MLHKGKILKDLIKSSSYTQTEIAEKIGLHKSQLSTLLNRPDIKDDVIITVCDILNVDKEIYFTESSSDTSYKSKYEKLKETYLNEKEQWLNKAEELMAENHALKEEVLKLRGR